MRRSFSCALFGSVVALIALTAGVSANPDADFYRGKVIRIIGPGSLGGPFDVFGRAIEPFMRKYIPGGPTIVVQAMPGAGGTVAANYLYEVAPRDGTLIGFLLPTSAFNQALGVSGVPYDAAKFNYLASIEPLSQTIMAGQKSPVRTLADARRIESTVGSSGQTSPTWIVPALANRFLGTKFRIVTGYRGAADIALAMERGEVGGIALNWHSLSANKATWKPGEAVFPIAHSGIVRNPDFPNTPTLIESADSDSRRKALEMYALTTALGRVLVAPPGVPKDRLEILRTAMTKVLRDPAFLAEAHARNLHIEPTEYREVERIVARTLSTPPEIIADIKQLLIAK